MPTETDMKKNIEYIGKDGLAELVTRIKEGFVQKETGKGLSTNDFTTIEKQKIQSVENGAQVNRINNIKCNGILVAPMDKAVNIVVPTKISQLTNDSTFTTVEEVNQAINTALHGQRKIVDSLPEAAEAEDMTIYMVKSTETGINDSYSEYMVVNGAFEKIGDTATGVDLSGVQMKADIKEITADEVSTIVQNAWGD